jgi:hypothetical protein
MFGLAVIARQGPSRHADSMTLHDHLVDDDVPFPRLATVLLKDGIEIHPICRPARKPSDKPVS